MTTTGQTFREGPINNLLVFSLLVVVIVVMAAVAYGSSQAEAREAQFQQEMLTLLVTIQTNVAEERRDNIAMMKAEMAEERRLLRDLLTCEGP